MAAVKGEGGVGVGLCGELGALTSLPPHRVESWLRYLMVGMFQGAGGPEESLLQENRALLHTLTEHIVRESSGVGEEFSLCLLAPLATELLSLPQGSTVGFSDLMGVLGGLAGAGQGQGHLTLFPAAVGWLQVFLS